MTESHDHSSFRFWLITFVTHNSRVSERMVRFGVRVGSARILNPMNQVAVARAILDACQRHNIKLLDLNVLPDHVHMILSAGDSGQLSDYVRRIKGYCSRVFRRQQSNGDSQPLWAQKFHRWPLRGDEELRGAQHYVRNNHLKHQEQWGQGLIDTWDKHLDPMIRKECASLNSILDPEPDQGAQAPC